MKFIRSKSQFALIEVLCAIALVAVTAAVILGAAGCTTTEKEVSASTNTVTGQVTLTTNEVKVLNQTGLDTTSLVVDSVVGIGLPIIAQEWPASVPDIQTAYIALSGVANGATTNSPSQVLALIGKNQQVPALDNAVTLAVQKLSALEQKLLNGSSNNAVVVFRTEAQAAVSAWPANLQ